MYVFALVGRIRSKCSWFDHYNSECHSAVQSAVGSGHPARERIIMIVPRIRSLSFLLSFLLTIHYAGLPGFHQLPYAHTSLRSVKFSSLGVPPPG